MISQSHKPAAGGDRLSPQKITVLGVGNLLLSDEGVGVHAANELAKMDLPPEVKVVEGGTGGFRLLNVVTDIDRLIVIDAVKGGGPPGSVYRFDIDDIKSCPAPFKTSLHQIGILEVLHLSALVGKTPRTTIIGIEPRSLEMGMELSSEIKAKVPKIIELVLKEIEESRNLPDSQRSPGDDDLMLKV